MFGIVFKRKKNRLQKLEFELGVGRLCLNSYLFSFNVILKGMDTLVWTLSMYLRNMYGKYSTSLQQNPQAEEPIIQSPRV